MKKLLIKQKNRCLIVKSSDILFCNSSSNYTIVHLQDKNPLTISKCLTKVEERLTEEDKMQILVLLRYIHSKIRNLSDLK